MELKCISGPCDGYYRFVDSRHKRGDIVNIPGPQQELRYTLDLDLDSIITQNYYQYKIEEFQGPEGQSLKFLIPAYEDAWNVFCSFFK